MPANSAKQQRAIASLLTGATQAEAAKAAGIHERTLARWLTDPDFVSELTSQRTQLAKRSLSSIQALAGDAVAALRDLLTSERESVKLRTAQYIIDKAAAHLELQDLQVRVENLENMTEDELKNLIARLEQQQ